jgi:hypothetical protein
MTVMKKIILSFIYPFWFFFAKTWLGNVMMIPITLLPIPLLVYLIFPDLMMETSEDAKGIGIGIGMLSLLCSPFVGVLFETISYKLESKYRP